MSPKMTPATRLPQEGRRSHLRLADRVVVGDGPYEGPVIAARFAHVQATTSRSGVRPRPHPARRLAVALLVTSVLAVGKVQIENWRLQQCATYHECDGGFGDRKVEAALEWCRQEALRGDSGLGECLLRYADRGGPPK